MKNNCSMDNTVKWITQILYNSGFTVLFIIKLTFYIYLFIEAVKQLWKNAHVLYL